MGAIPRRYIHKLETVIQAVGDKWERFHNVGFTHDEFLSLFAPVEHHKLLREASEIAEVEVVGGGCHYASFTHSKFSEVFGSPTVQLNFFVHNSAANPAPLLPRNHVVLASADPQVISKLAEWVIERGEIGFGIARVKAVLNYLDINCSTPNEVRFIWPTLLALCSRDDELANFADKLREVRPPKSMPPLPPEVRAGVRASAGTIASAMLLGEPEPFVAPVTVSILTFVGVRKEGALGTLSVG